MALRDIMFDVFMGGVGTFMFVLGVMCIVSLWREIPPRRRGFIGSISKPTDEELETMQAMKFALHMHRAAEDFFRENDGEE